MITKFGTLFAGHVDMEAVGLAAPAVNDRLYPNEHLITAFDRAEDMAKLMDDLGYHTLWLAEHHFQREGYECIPNILMLAMHLTSITRKLKIGSGFNITTMWHPSPPSRGLRHRRRTHQGPRHLRGWQGLPHPGG